MFNAKQVKADLVKWIQKWFEENGPDCSAVIGISGGKDSSVVAALCVEALGNDRVIGVMMPNGGQRDICVAREVIDHLGIPSMLVDISIPTIAIENNILLCNNTSNRCIWGLEISELSNQTKINLPPRIRMATLYAISQSVNGRVSNNCNLSEDWVGYSTRWGDSVGDFAPLANLTVTEVKKIGYELGLPKQFIEKIPSDGLCGKTDEDNLGFSYDTLDKYLRTGICEDADAKMKIDKLHNKNLFKMKPIPSFHYDQRLLMDILP